MKHVKWVTANTRNDVMGVLFGVLTDGKDYKVLEVYDQWEDGFSYAVKTDTGAFQRLHESWFDKPATLKTQPTPCDEIGCDSFEDLVYVKPLSTNTYQYFRISKEDCSEDQWRYLVNYFANPHCLGVEETLQCCPADEDFWFDNEPDPTDTHIIFNDIFKHKSEV